MPHTAANVLTTAPGLTYQDLLTAGLSPRRIDHWTKLGYLHLTAECPGSGHHRRWDDAERHVAVMMTRLRAAGLTIEAAHRAARGDTYLAPGITLLIAPPGGYAPDYDYDYPAMPALPKLVWPAPLPDPALAGPALARDPIEVGG